jgi:hypothetical protein
MVKVPKKTDVMSSGRVAVDAGIGAAIAGVTANILGAELGILVGGILGGAAIGGTTGQMVTVNAVQDAVTAMFVGGMGSTGDGGAVM